MKIYKFRIQIIIITLASFALQTEVFAENTSVKQKAFNNGASPIIAGGFNGGGGGDTLHCTQDSSNQLNGYYNLDYLATYKKSNLNSDVVTVNTWEESKERIINNLKRLKSFNLLGSFNYFVNNLMKEGGYTSGISWIEAGYGIVDIKDERLTNLLPKNCLNQDSLGTSHFIQTVYWEDINGSIHYKYDNDIIEKLKQSPLQISYLYVHEWLWTHFKNPEHIRLINQMLHSKKMDDINQQEFNSFIATYTPVFHPKLPTRGTFESQEGDIIYYSSFESPKTSTVSFGFTTREKVGSYTSSAFKCNFGENGKQVCRSMANSTIWYPLASAPNLSINDVVIEIINFYSFSIRVDNKVKLFELKPLDDF